MKWLRCRAESGRNSGSLRTSKFVGGGAGRPDGAEADWFVKPIVFAGFDNDRTIAREEISGRFSTRPSAQILPHSPCLSHS